MTNRELRGVSLPEAYVIGFGKLLKIGGGIFLGLLMFDIYQAIKGHLMYGGT